MNNGKYKTPEYLKKQAEKLDRVYGEQKIHSLSCESCGKVFEFLGRAKTKAFENKRFCTRRCANRQGGKALAEIREQNGQLHYVTICKKYHKWECLICGEKNIVSVHHVNHNHHDDRPENLVPLCPTHHQYVHSPFADLVLPQIEEYVLNWACS